MRAVTDFRGVRIWLELAHSPSFRGASSRVNRAPWMDRGRSPYPGLKRNGKKQPGYSACRRASTWSHSCSTAAVAQQSRQRAWSISLEGGSKCPARAAAVRWIDAHRPPPAKWETRGVPTGDRLSPAWYQHTALPSLGGMHLPVPVDSPCTAVSRGYPARSE